MIPTPTPTGTRTPIPPPAAVLRFGPRTTALSSEIEVNVGRAVIREGRYGVLFYVATAPPHLDGWQLLPGKVEVLGAHETRYEVIESKTLTSRGRLTLGSLSFAVGRLPPGVLEVRIHDFIAASEGRVPRIIEGLWPLAPLERTDAEWPPADESDMFKDECIVAGDAAIAFDGGLACIKYELVLPTHVPTTPATVAFTPRPRPTPSPTPTLHPLLPPPPTHTPTPTPVLPRWHPLSFALCTPWLFRLHVFVQEDGTVLAPPAIPVTSAKCILNPEGE